MSLTDSESRIRTVRDMLARVEKELLVHTAHMDDIFWQVQAIIRENPAIASGGPFQKWIAQCYADSVTAGARRLADERRDVVSLWRVLEGMVSIAPLLTKSRFVSLHDGALRGGAETLWRDLVGESETLSTRLVRAKQRDLKTALEKVSQFANENVAHLSATPAHAETTFEDVRISIVSAFRLYTWCSQILIGRAYSSPVPRNPRLWLRVFHVPWIQPGQRVPQYRSLDKVLDEESVNQPSGGRGRA